MDALQTINSKAVKALFLSIDGNVRYFSGNGKHQQLKTNLEKLKANLENCYGKIHEIQSFASEYDIDADTPANGYRSFVDIFGSVITETSNICHKINTKKQNFFFRADHFAEYEVQR
jgi:hypothetical protein